MWKSLLLIVVAFPLSLAMWLMFWAGEGLKAGIIAGSATFAICLVASTLMIFTLRKMSLVDVFLPTIFSVVWSVVLIPFSFGTEVFTAPAAIGSGLVLTLCLWKYYHNRSIGKNWLILPAIVYMYEMLPVNIPGPFDDYFCFGGSVICTLLLYTSTSFKDELPGASKNNDLPSAWSGPGRQPKIIEGSYQSESDLEA